MAPFHLSFAVPKEADATLFGLYFLARGVYSYGFKKGTR